MAWSDVSNQFLQGLQFGLSRADRKKDLAYRMARDKKDDEARAAQMEQAGIKSRIDAAQSGIDLDPATDSDISLARQAESESRAAADSALGAGGAQAAGIRSVDPVIAREKSFGDLASRMADKQRAEKSKAEADVEESRARADYYRRGGSPKNPPKDSSVADMNRAIASLEKLGDDRSDEQDDILADLYSKRASKMDIPQRSGGSGKSRPGFLSRMWGAISSPPMSGSAASIVSRMSGRGREDAAPLPPPARTGTIRVRASNGAEQDLPDTERNRALAAQPGYTLVE